MVKIGMYLTISISFLPKFVHPPTYRNIHRLIHT